jgi:ubiquinone/menaquinone biosynthesis C-methylase UbiE
LATPTIIHLPYLRKWLRMTRLWVDVMNESRVGHYMDALEKAFVARHLPPAPLRILDIGGGTGRWSAWLSEHGYQSTVLELDAPNLQRLRQVAPHLQAVQADALQLPFPNSIFDAAIAIQVLGLLPDNPRFFAECSRVLRAGGLLFTSWTNRASLKGLLFQRYQDLKGTTRAQRYGFYQHSHADQLAEFCAAGFSPLETLGYSWPLLPRGHNSPLVDVAAGLEKVLGLRAWVSASPNVLIAGRKP